MQRAQIAELKAHLSKYLAQVRTGDTVIVCDRHTPIARLVPYAETDDGFVVHAPTRPAKALRAIRGIKIKRAVDVVALLRRRTRPAVNVYLDTSTVLRVLLRQPKPLAIWAGWERAYASELLHVEACRVIDRLRLEGILDDHGVADAHEELVRIESVIANIPLSRPVVERASLPMATVVKSLDALHLASAMLLRERLRITLVFATHDPQQARAARALGFDCIGV